MLREFDLLGYLFYASLCSEIVPFRASFGASGKLCFVIVAVYAIFGVSGKLCFVFVSF